MQELKTRLEHKERDLQATMNHQSAMLKEIRDRIQETRVEEKNSHHKKKLDELKQKTELVGGNY